MESSGPDFQLCLLQAWTGVFGPIKVIKIRLKYFSTVLTVERQELHPKQYGWVLRAKPSHLCSVFRFSCSGTFWAWKIRQDSIEIFYCRIDEERYELHPKHCGYVLGAKRSYPGPVFNFVCSKHVPVVSGHGKVLKTWLKHFLAVMTGNDKNCTPNVVGMFRVQNEVFRARFSTLPAPGLFMCVSDLEKSSKFDWNIFQLYWRETRRTTPQTLLVCFGCKKESVGAGFQLCRLQACFGRVQTRKSHQNSTETFFSRTDGKHWELHPKQCGYVSGAKPSHLSPVFNFFCYGAFWAQKSRQNSTEIFNRHIDEKQ